MERLEEITEHLVWEQKSSSESQKYWSIRRSGVLIQKKHFSRFTVTVHIETVSQKIPLAESDTTQSDEQREKSFTNFQS